MKEIIFDYSERVVLVTGAASGLGKGLATAFANSGASVILADINLDGLRKTLDGLPNTEKHLAIQLDVSKPEESEKTIREVINRYGKIDFLMNNAGMNIRKPVTEFTVEDWEKVIGVNLKGSFFTAQIVGKYMVSQNFGRIVSTASVSAVLGHPNLGIYAASKGGIRQFTKTMANEWALNNITVNAIGPGYVVTEQTKEFVSNESVFNNLVSKVPMKRLGTVEDMAGTAMFLCSPAASYITGQLILVDGGRTID